MSSICTFLYIFCNKFYTIDDYEAGPYNVIFTEGSNSSEFCINITNDTKLEDDRKFTLRINEVLLDPGIISVFPNKTDVLIMDDECKFL